MHTWYEHSTSYYLPVVVRTSSSITMRQTDKVSDVLSAVKKFGCSGCLRSARSRQQIRYLYYDSTCHLSE